MPPVDPNQQARPTASVVNALIDPLLEVVRASIGIELRRAGLALTEQRDPPPNISVTIEFRGRVAGPVTWVFPAELAREAARAMLGMAAAEPVDDDSCRGAVAEIANIASGNATGVLSAFGYEASIRPPEVHDHNADTQLDERRLVAVFDSAAGPIKVIIGVHVAEPA